MLGNELRVGVVRESRWLIAFKILMTQLGKIVIVIITIRRRTIIIIMGEAGSSVFPSQPPMHPTWLGC